MAEAMSDERIEHIGILLSAPDVGGIAQVIARELLAELKQARAQLAEIGETKAEWAADGPAGWFQWPAGARSEWSERFARGVVEGAAEKGVEVKLKRRLVGGWRDAE